MSVLGYGYMGNIWLSPKSQAYCRTERSAVLPSGILCRSGTPRKINQGAFFRNESADFLPVAAGLSDFTLSRDNASLAPEAIASASSTTFKCFHRWKV